MTPSDAELPAQGDRLVAALRADIRTLALHPGQRLLTNFLVARYGTGPSPLREALCILSGEGLVLRESHRGFSVSPMSLGDLDDLVAARLTIETGLMERSIAAGDAEWEARITATLAALGPSLQKVGDSRPIDREWEANHRAFHFALLAGAKASLMMEFCTILYDRYDRYRVLGIPRRAYLAAVADDHAELARAALDRDGAGAAAILKRHISDTSATVRTNIAAANITDSGGVIRLPADGTAADGIAIA